MVSGSLLNQAKARRSLRAVSLWHWMHKETQPQNGMRLCSFVLTELIILIRQVLVRLEKALLSSFKMLSLTLLLSIPVLNPTLLVTHKVVNSGLN